MAENSDRNLVNLGEDEDVFIDTIDDLDRNLIAIIVIVAGCVL